MEIEFEDKYRKQYDKLKSTYEQKLRDEIDFYKVFNNKLDSLNHALTISLIK